MRHWSLYSIVGLLSILFLTPSVGYARERKTSGAALELGAGIGPILPLGDFRRNIGGWGTEKGTLNLDLILPLNRSGIFRLRFDGLLLGSYIKNLTPEHCYDLTLDGFSLGSEIGLPHGPIQPYANVGYGWSFLKAGNIDDAVTRKIDDRTHGAGGWIFGSGLRIPLGSRKRWAVDIGARYYRLGESTYLSNGGIQKNSDGSYNIVTTSSEAPFLMFSLGFQYRIYALK